MDYNKEFKAKDRRIVTSGPRDRQMKQQAAMYSTEALQKIEALQTKVEELTKATTKTSDFSTDEINEIIIKAVKEETTKLKDKHDIEKEKLQNKITQLEERIETSKKAHDQEITYLREAIKTKDDLITQIKEVSNLSDNKLTSLLKETTEKIGNIVYSQGDAVPTEDSRPQMETVFVDPIDKESKTENHFILDKVQKDAKDKLNNKLGKLKGLGVKV